MLNNISICFCCCYKEQNVTPSGAGHSQNVLDFLKVLWRKNLFVIAESIRLAGRNEIFFITDFRNVSPFCSPGHLGRCSWSDILYLQDQKMVAAKKITESLWVNQLWALSWLRKGKYVLGYKQTLKMIRQAQSKTGHLHQQLPSPWGNLK